MTATFTPYLPKDAQPLEHDDLIIQGLDIRGRVVELGDELLFVPYNPSYARLAGTSVEVLEVGGEFVGRLEK